MTPEQVSDEMVEAVLEKLDVTPYRVDLCRAIAAAINASGCVLVPESMLWDLLDTVDQVRSARRRGEEDWSPLNTADDRLRELLDAAVMQQEQAK